MTNAILMQWKSFNVPTDKLNHALKGILGSNYDGLVCEPNEFYVVFKVSPTQEEADTLNTYWDAVVAAQFSPTLREIISGKINEASVFGNALILDAAVENVQMGVTQAGKTRLVADYCSNVQRYLQSGSLYAAVSEINDLIAAGVPENLAPFITVDRLNTYKAKIEAYLAS